MKRFLSVLLIIFSLVFVVACGKTGSAKIEGKDSVDVRLGDPNFDIMAGIKATDEVNGDVTKSIKVDGTVDVNKEGNYDVTFSVKGSNGTLYTLAVVFKVKAATLRGGEDRNITVGVAEFDPLLNVYLIDGVAGIITSGAEIQPEYKITIMFEGEEVEKVDTSELGVYHITYEVKYGGVTSVFERTISVVEEITWGGLGTKDLETGEYQGADLEIGWPFNPTSNVTALQPTFDEEGNRTTRVVTPYIRVVENNVDNTQPGEYVVKYKIEDPDNLDQDPVVYLQEQGEDVEVIRNIRVYNKIEILGAANAQVTRGTAFDPKEGVTAKDSKGSLDASKIEIVGSVDVTKDGTYELTYKIKGSFDDEFELKRTITVVPPISGVVNIYFMSGDVTENDPFLDDYGGLRQKERQNLQTAAEKKYNVKVHYVSYPANAAWGDSRVTAMVNASIDGKPLADLYYHISSDWIPRLAAGGAIAPIDDLIKSGVAKDVPQSIRDSSKYHGKVYGFSNSGLGLESGLYYNADLVHRLGLPNPTQMYLNGQWSWSEFKAWAIQANAALAEDEYVLGGVLTEYAEHLVPLNGGEFVNEPRARIDFDNQLALETYDFIKELYDAKLFEPSGDYDAGSVDWKTGKVIFHHGHFWFVNAQNRWGNPSGDPEQANINFELGFVPFPMSDDYIAKGGVYRSPVYGPSFPVLAEGMTAERKELVFKVWWEMQRNVPAEEAYEEFENLLKERFNKDIYVEAYLTIYDKAYRSVLYGMGISRYTVGSYASAINAGIPAGDFRSRLGEIKPGYETALKNYLAEE